SVDDACAVGREERCPVRADTRVRDLPNVAAVAVHHEQLERGRPPDALLQEREVAVELLTRLDRAAAPDDLRAVSREERPAVRAGTMGQATNIGSIAVHRIDLHVAG